MKNPRPGKSFFESAYDIITVSKSPSSVPVTVINTVFAYPFIIILFINTYLNAVNLTSRGIIISGLLRYAL